MASRQLAAAGDPEVALRVEGLRKRFGDLVAVDGLSLEVHRGEVLAFLGPNGAGKTTSLKLMCGLLRPDAGTITLHGRPVVAGRSRGLREVGIAPQELMIWEMLTCAEQLELAARLYDVPRRAARARAAELLQALGLAEQAHTLGRALSGGMQRRLNIALGLVHQPRLLLLDEPQAGLDPQSRLLVREHLRSLKGTLTVVLTTHDMEEAEKLADRVCIVDHGKLLVLDTVARLTGQHGPGRVVEVAVGGGAASTLLAAVGPLAPPGTITLEGDRLRVPLSGPGALLARVLEHAGRLGLEVTSVRTREATLEDVFIGLTGRRLRE